MVVESSQSKLDAERRGRLRANVDLAEELGAHVVTLFGDDIAQQIAQYAETAGATHIVVGNAIGGFRALGWGPESLVNRLMKLAHGAVVDVVPTKDLPAQYGRLREATGFHFTVADIWRALASVALATALGLVIYELGLAGSVVLMLYLIVALLMATRADGFFYALFASLGSVFAYNFFFTVPRFTLHAVGLNYPFIFAFLLVGTFAASSLAIRMKRQAESTARRAYRMEVLLESSRKLQGASTADECFRFAAEQVIKLLNRPVVMYRMLGDGSLANPELHDVPGTIGGATDTAVLASPAEAAVAAWSASNNERAGATTDTLANAHCLYLPIRSKDVVFGVAGVAMDDIDGEEDFGAFEKNLLLAILDECGQATEQILFADERRRMEMRMEKRCARTCCGRSLMICARLSPAFRGMRTCCCDEDTDSAAEAGACCAIFTTTRVGWSRWVENLLSITRIDNGTMQLAVQPGWSAMWCRRRFGMSIGALRIVACASIWRTSCLWPRWTRA